MIADDGGPPQDSPPSIYLWIAVSRDAASHIRPTVCRLLVHVDFGLAHGVPNGLDTLVGLFTNDHFFSFAGPLFDYRLLVPFRHLKLAFLHGAGISANSAGC